MKFIRFKVTDAEYQALSKAADDGKHQKQTPSELAHDGVCMFLVTEQAKADPPETESGSPNFTLILRAYNDRITGAVVFGPDGDIGVEGDMVTGPERDLIDGEVELAQPLLSVFCAENDLLLNINYD